MILVHLSSVGLSYRNAGLSCFPVPLHSLYSIYCMIYALNSRSDGVLCDYTYVLSLYNSYCNNPDSRCLFNT